MVNRALRAIAAAAGVAAILLERAGESLSELDDVLSDLVTTVPSVVPEAWTEDYYQ